jgi:hypothetical protein
MHDEALSKFPTNENCQYVICMKSEHFICSFHGSLFTAHMTSNAWDSFRLACWLSCPQADHKTPLNKVFSSSNHYSKIRRWYLSRSVQDGSGCTWYRTGCISIFLLTRKIMIKDEENTVEPGYNDIGLCDTSSIASDILWYQLIPHC